MISILVFIAIIVIIFTKSFFHYKFLRAQHQDPLKPEEYSRAFERIWAQAFFPFSGNERRVEKEAINGFFIFAQARNEEARHAKIITNIVSGIGVCLMAFVFYWKFLL
jgi:hypothetical protein